MKFSSKDFYDFLGNKIQEYRKLKNYSQEQLGKVIDLSRTSIVHIEKGNQKIPIYKLFILAFELNIEIGNFFPRIEKNDKLIDLISKERISDLSSQKKILEILKKEKKNAKQK